MVSEKTTISVKGMVGEEEEKRFPSLWGYNLRS